MKNKEKKFRQSPRESFNILYFFSFQVVFQLSSMMVDDMVGTLLYIPSLYIFVVFLESLSRETIKSKKIKSLLLEEYGRKAVKTFSLTFFGIVFFVVPTFFLYFLNLSISESFFQKFIWVAQCVVFSYFSYCFCNKSNEDFSIILKKAVSLMIDKVFFMVLALFVLVLCFQLYVVGKSEYFSGFFINLTIPMSLSVLFIHCFSKKHSKRIA